MTKWRLCVLPLGARRDDALGHSSQLRLPPTSDRLGSTAAVAGGAVNVRSRHTSSATPAAGLHVPQRRLSFRSVMLSNRVRRFRRNGWCPLGRRLAPLSDSVYNNLRRPSGIAFGPSRCSGSQTRCRSCTGFPAVLEHTCCSQRTGHACRPDHQIRWAWGSPTRYAVIRYGWDCRNVHAPWGCW